MDGTGQGIYFGLRVEGEENRYRGGASIERWKRGGCETWFCGTVGDEEEVIGDTDYMSKMR